MDVVAADGDRADILQDIKGASVQELHAALAHALQQVDFGREMELAAFRAAQEDLGDQACGLRKNILSAPRLLGAHQAAGQVQVHLLQGRRHLLVEQRLRQAEPVQQLLVLHFKRLELGRVSHGWLASAGACCCRIFCTRCCTW